MLRTKPKLSYVGLTLVLSNVSRFDKLSLLSSTGGVFFNNECLQPDYNMMQCDVRLADDTSPFLPNTRCIILFGEYAMHKYVADTRNNTLNEMRGSPLYVGSIPAIASYNPQDCADFKAYEQKFNTESKDYSGEEDSEEDGDEGDVKTFSNTKRSNYGFWLKSDIRKCKELLLSKTTKWPVESPPIYKIYPTAEEVVNVLTNTKGQYLDFDIETDYEEQNLLCFAFTFDGRTVYSVPVLDFNYHWAYSSLPLIIRALTIAIRDNILVAHNGAAFDFFVLGHKYHIPIHRAYDTMLAMHRCFPDVEKSLGHCVSYWTYQRFHKDTDSRAFRTQQHLMEKLKYCAKDVFTMHLVRKAITSYANTIPGLNESISCAMRSIRPYLICMLQGIRYSEQRVKEICDENDKLMMQYNRIIEILIGPSGMAEVRTAVKSKAKMFAGSNAQCCKYFHEMLGYPVLFRSDKTEKPSLGKTIMFKLAIAHKNPVITFVLLYRITQKEYGAMNFIPWRDDNNKIVDVAEWVEGL